jgi:hypothetical protein
MKLFEENRKCRLIAAVIVLATLALLIKKHWHPANDDTEPAVNPTPIPVSYATEELLSFEDRESTWTSQKQPNGEPLLFELFSPPNVYYEGERLVIEPCNHWQFDAVFPLRLKHIFRKKYRLQLEGYIQANETDEVTVFIHDLESDQTMHCTVGQVFKTLEFEILSFKMRTIEKDDMIINMPTLQIRDTRDRIEVELTGDTKYYDDKYEAVLEDVDGKTYILSRPGEEMKIGESYCTLQSIDPMGNTVIITLTDANHQEFYKRLHMIK